MTPPSSPSPSPLPSPRGSDNTSAPRKVKPGALSRSSASLNLVDMKDRDEKARAVKERARELRERIEKRNAYKISDPNRDVLSKTPFEHFKTLYELMGKASIVETSVNDKNADSVVITQRKAELRNTNLEIGKILNILKSSSLINIHTNLNQLHPLLTADEKTNFCNFLISRMGLEWSLNLVEVIFEEEVKNLDVADSINRDTTTLGATFVTQVQKVIILPIMTESLLKIINAPDEDVLKESDTALNLIFDSLKKASHQNLINIKRFYAHRYKTAIKKAGVDPIQGVSSLLFLRFIGPALTDPKKVGLKTENQKLKVVKVLNGIVNQAVPRTNIVEDKYKNTPESRLKEIEEFIINRANKIKEISQFLTAA